MTCLFLIVVLQTRPFALLFLFPKGINFLIKIAYKCSDFSVFDILIVVVPSNSRDNNLEILTIKQNIL